MRVGGCTKPFSEIVPLVRFSESGRPELQAAYCYAHVFSVTLYFVVRYSINELWDWGPQGEQISKRPGVACLSGQAG